MGTMADQQIEYYKAVGGQSNLNSGIWYVNNNKRHAFSVYTDYDVIDEDNERILLPSADQSSFDVNSFSNQISPVLYNTKYVSDFLGGEDITLELDSRVISLILDQSGSMTWNDNEGLRFEVIKEFLDRVDSSYPGNIYYNLFEYSGRPIQLIFFAAPSTEQINTTNADDMVESFFSSDASGFTGIRVVRNNERYPTSPLDGDIILDGYTSKVYDSGLTTDKTYYYTVFTKNKYNHFSTGKQISVTPRTKEIPRGVAILNAIPLKGSAYRRNSNSYLLLHFDEADDVRVYDFSPEQLILTSNNSNILWLPQNRVPSGKSGLRFDGTTDYLISDDVVNEKNTRFTLMAWIYCYGNGDSQQYILDYAFKENTPPYYHDLYAYYSPINDNIVIGSTTDSGTWEVSTQDLSIERNVWTHIAFTVDLLSPGNTITSQINNGLIKGYIDGQEVILSGTGNVSSISTSITKELLIGCHRELPSGYNSFYHGKISDITIQNEILDANTIAQYAVSNLDSDLEVIDDDTDNGDRINVIWYRIPHDYNFENGNLTISKRFYDPPSWHSDEYATTIYTDSNPQPGNYYFTDYDDLVLGNTVYYRAFSFNSIGNVCYDSDAKTSSVDIPETSAFLPEMVEVSGYSYFNNTPYTLGWYGLGYNGQVLYQGWYSPYPTYVSGEIYYPFDFGSRAGDEKVYISWSNPTSSYIKRIKIFSKKADDYNAKQGDTSKYPTIDIDSNSDGELVFEGEISNTYFVHKNLENNKRYYYTFVYVDKYDRAYYLYASTTYATPQSGLNEVGIPVDEVEQIHYELLTNTSIALIWDVPYPTAKDLTGYVDQQIYFYASLTDEYGRALPDETNVEMTVTPSITTRDGSFVDFDNICSGGTTTPSYTQNDLYSFDVKQSDSIIRGILRLTKNSNLLGLIDSANFTVSVNAIVNSTTTSSSDVDTKPGSYWSKLLSSHYIDSIFEEESDEESTTLFKFTSTPISVSLSNPFNMRLENRDRKFISERCYFIEADNVSTVVNTTLKEKWEKYDGVYIGASQPFVARAILSYKDDVLTNDAFVNVKICDATMDLCEGSGYNIQESEDIFPVNSRLPVLQGTDALGNSISYVDIPINTPDRARAINLHVQSRYLGYEIIQTMYIVFQSTLRINLLTNAPRPDGSSAAEQQAIVYNIDPNYPYDTSKATKVDDLNIVSWGMVDRNDWVIQEDTNDGANYSIPFYSIDNVPITSGVYSYTRNGTARNVFFGPTEYVTPPLESYEIYASVTIDNTTKKARDIVSIQAPSDITDDLVFGDRFLMEMEEFTNNMWSDGINYKKIYVSRQPAVSTTKYSSCFRECSSTYNKDPLELNIGQIVEVTSSDADVEFLWGDVTEFVDPYTGESSLSVGPNAHISYGTAEVELDSDEVTTFYCRLAKTQTGQSYKPVYDTSGCECTDQELDDIINPCRCLLPPSGITACDAKCDQGRIVLSGKTTVFIENIPVELVGGGSYRKGVPPVTIEDYSPLRVEIVDVKLNGQTVWFPDESVEEPKSREITIDGNSTLIVTAQVTFRGENIPDGYQAQGIVDTESGSPSNLILESNFVDIVNEVKNDINPQEIKSYAEITVYPIATPEEGTNIIETLRIISTYDELGTITRRCWDSFTIKVVKEFSEGGDDASDVIDDPQRASVYSKTLEVYDINNENWSVKTSMNYSRGNLNLEYCNGKVYAIGGVEEGPKDVDKRIVKYTESYSPLYDSWSIEQLMPTARFGSMSAVYNGYIYIIGGIEEDVHTSQKVVSNKLEVFDTATGTWSSLSSMPTVNSGSPSEKEYGICYGTAQYIQVGSSHRIYVFSGARTVDDKQNVRQYNDRILYYDIDNDAWHYSDDLEDSDLAIYKRLSPSSFVYGNSIVVFNGSVQKERSETILYAVDSYLYDIASGSISVSDGYFDILPIIKCQSGYTTVGNCTYIMGGTSDDSNQLKIFERICINDNPYSDSSQFQYTLLDNMLTSKTGISATSSTMTYQEVVAGDQPYIYWTMDDADGSNVIIDKMNNIDGVAVSCNQGEDSLLTDVSSANKSIQRQNIAASTFYSNQPVFSNSWSAYTVEFWFNQAAFLADVYVPIVHQADIVGDLGIFLYNPAGTRQILVVDGGVTYIFTSYAFSVDTTYHVVIIRDSTSSGGNIKLYIDGVLEETQVSTADSRFGAVNLQCDDYIGVGTAYTGNIDEFAVYNKALSGNQILKHYQIGVDSFPTNINYDASFIDASFIYVVGGFTSGRGEGFTKINWSFV